MLDETPNLAVFVDYENVALGAREAEYGRFAVELVLARLLDKGKVVHKKAYADWSRYEREKRPMHEASFELVEVPHASYSGKNSADIRLVVDALDLCYTKPHVTMFVIVSGDSDFSPLVSKLRENDKAVVGVGVKNSSSDLLVENCDDFLYYDDLVREARRTRREREQAKADASSKGPAERHTDELREEALDLVLATVEALFRERDDQVWGSHVKQVLKRKRPNFAESYYGYGSFNDLLEDARKRGLLKIEKDEKSGGYRVLALGRHATSG
jgi:uncharacterized LabA/DUF88 family protein